MDKFLRGYTKMIKLKIGDRVIVDPKSGLASKYTSPGIITKVLYQGEHVDVFFDNLREPTSFHPSWLQLYPEESIFMEG